MGQDQSVDRALNSPTFQKKFTLSVLSYLRVVISNLLTTFSYHISFTETPFMAIVTPRLCFDGTVYLGVFRVRRQFE